ncbi:hypothetical protein Tco_0962548 [Tanacetum coccineum]
MNDDQTIGGEGDGVSNWTSSEEKLELVLYTFRREFMGRDLFKNGMDFVSAFPNDIKSLRNSKAFLALVEQGSIVCSKESSSLLFRSGLDLVRIRFGSEGDGLTFKCEYDVLPRLHNSIQRIDENRQELEVGGIWFPRFHENTQEIQGPHSLENKGLTV